MSKPLCFGPIASVTPGTNVPLAVNASTTSIQIQSSKAWTVQAIRANAVANTGVVVIGVAGMKKATGAGVIAYLSAGTYFNAGTNSDSDAYDLTSLVMDAYNAGDSVILTSFA